MGKIYIGSTELINTSRIDTLETNIKQYGNDWVDLGLPSGTLWRNRNIGAENPEDAGLFFAFGYLDGQYSGSITVYVNNYINPYNATYPIPLSLDAARAILGPPCRIPSKEECAELFTYTTCQEYMINDVNGFLLTSTINSKQIFFPITGCVYNSNSVNVYKDTHAIFRTTESSHNTGYCYLSIINNSGTSAAGYHIQRFTCAVIRAVQ